MVFRASLIEALSRMLRTLLALALRRRRRHGAIGVRVSIQSICCALVPCLGRYVGAHCEGVRVPGVGSDQTLGGLLRRQDLQQLCAHTHSESELRVLADMNTGNGAEQVSRGAIDEARKLHVSVQRSPCLRRSMRTSIANDEVCAMQSLARSYSVLCIINCNRCMKDSCTDTICRRGHTASPHLSSAT